MKKTIPPVCLWLLLPLAGGLWHFLDVLAGASATGEEWLLIGYGLLFLFLADVLLGLTGILTEPSWLRKLSSRRKQGGPGREPVAEIYMTAGLLLGLAFLFVTPPLSAPDEISHYVSAYQLSSRLLGQPATAADGHVLIRAEDAWIEDLDGIRSYQKNEEGFWEPADYGMETLLLAQHLEQDSYRTIYRKGAEGSSQVSFAYEPGDLAVSPFPPVVTTPAAYLPQALGIAVARLLGLSTIPLLFLGRLGNLLFLTGATTYAIRRTPFGKELFAGVGLLPMTLHLAASYSYDCMILAGMFVLTALCLDLIFTERTVQLPDLLLLLVIMAAAAPCKMIYVILAGLCLLIPVRKFGSPFRFLAAGGLAVGVWAAVMFLVNRQNVVTYAGSAEVYVEWAEETGYSLSYLLHNPLQTVRIFYQTLLWQLDSYHLTMIGGWLGNLDEILDVPDPAVWAYTGALILLALKKPGESCRFTVGQRLWAGFLCAATAGAVLLSMLIAWTPVSSPVILGVQGRYFLPFLPLLLMLCKNDSVVLTKDRNRSILYVVCCLDSYVLLRLYSIVCLRV